MTFLELCQALRSECSVAGVGPDRVQNQTGSYLQLVNWIRQANMEIQATYFNWKFLFRKHVHSEEALKRLQIDPAMPLVKAPDDLHIWRRDSFKLHGEPLPVVEYHTGFNSDYLCYGVLLPNNDVELVGVPAGMFPAITADYYCQPQTLLKDEDEPWFPAPYHYLIVYRAMMMYANWDNAPEVKGAAVEGWQQLMPRLEASQLPLQEDTMVVNEQPIIVRPE